MPGTLQVLNIRYHLSHFQKSEKTWPRITKREMKATHLELGCSLPLKGRQSHDKTELEKRHDEKDRKPPSHLFGIFIEITRVPLHRRGPTRLGESPMGWGPAAHWFLG